MPYDFSVHSQGYEQNLGESHKYFVRVKCEVLLRTLRRFSCNPKRVLDLGCGTGEAEEILGRFFDEMTGIDSSEGMVNEAKRKNIINCDFKQADVLELPFPGGHFDLVFSFCLFHHLSKNEWKQAMAEAVRVSKDSAILLTFEHNPKNLITRHMVRKSPIDEGVTLISPSKMEELYTEAEVEIIEKRFIIFFPGFLSFLRPLENVLYGLPYGGQYYVAGLVR